MSEPRFTLSHIAGEDAKRDTEFLTTGFAGSDRPGTLCCAANRRYLCQASQNDAIRAVVVPTVLADAVPDQLGLVVDDAPLKRFYELHNSLVCNFDLGRISAPARSPSANIHPTAIVGENVIIGERVSIGQGAIVDNCILESDASVGPGAMVGVEGHFFKDFGHLRLKVEHGGLTHICRGGQILAGAIVQRGVFSEPTLIGPETVVGPSVLIAHGATIGSSCILAGGAQVAGFAKIGERVWVGPAAVVSNLVEIGDNARIEIGAIVARSVPAGQRQSGSYATDHVRNLRFHAELWRS